MITYLKHVGNFKHANLKGRKFEDIQAYENFISTGSAKDERLIKRMNEKRGGLSKSEVIKEDTKEEVKDEVKDEEVLEKKLGTRKKIEVKKKEIYSTQHSEDDRQKGRSNAGYQLVMNKYQDEMPEVLKEFFGEI
ncbi:hypothetical protein Tco_0441471 [Tanacetum coccineum]